MIKVIAFDDAISGLKTEYLMGHIKTNSERAMHYEELINLVIEKYSNMKFVQYIPSNNKHNPLFVFECAD